MTGHHSVQVPGAAGADPQAVAAASTSPNDRRPEQHLLRLAAACRALADCDAHQQLYTPLPSMHAALEAIAAAVADATLGAAGGVSAAMQHDAWADAFRPMLEVCVFTDR